MSDPNGFSINQKFDEVGNLSEVTRQATGSTVTITNSIIYDKLGRKISQVDPDMGNWSYRYNAMNEVVSQTDALGQTISHKIDALGRIWQTTTPGLSTASGDFIMAARFEDSDMPPSGAGGNIIDTTTFDTAFAGLGLPESSTRVEPGAANFTQTIEYDALSRVNETATLIDAQTVTEQVIYDSIGRPFKHFTRFADATGSYDEGTETAFNSKGYPHKVCRTFDASTNVSNCAVSGSDLYYQALTYSPRGQVTQEKRANNVSLTVDRSFNTQTGRLAVQNVNSGSLQSWQLQFDRVGNLSERFDARTNQREVLTYDKLDRLTNVTRNGTANLALEYDSLGNICSKTKELAAAQTYSYGAASGCSSNFAAGISPHQVKNAFGKSFSYNDDGDMTTRTMAGSSLSISYDATRLSRVISATGTTNAKSSFWYSPGGSRYKRIDEKNGSITRTVRYFGAVEKEITPTKTLIRESIGGFLLINREVIGASVQRQYRYMFADHLGSVDLITDENANIIERMSFDAHGARRQDSAWSQSILNYQPDTTLRGFTGQEMLDDLGLVHMNARIYDPELGKFLQADSEVEDDATQGLNRYSYCLNNPLSLTDPTGHRSKALGYLKAVVAIIVSIYLPGIAAGVLGNFGAVVFSGFVSGTITGGLQGGLEGAFSAGLFYGIGSHFAGLKKIKEGTSGFAGSGFTRGVFAQKVLAHATAGGTLSVLQGGKFGHGFVSAGITEAVSPTIDNLQNDFAQVAASAIVGGSTSVIAGGKFGNGAMTGAFQMAFNKLQHKIHVTKVGDITLELSTENAKGGYDSADSAADAQFDAYSEEHASTEGKGMELKGAIISKGKRFYFTTMSMGPAKWAGRYIPGKSLNAGFSWAAFTHTHPDNSSFNGVDFENIKNYPGYVRSLNGRMYRWDVTGADAYRANFENRLRSGITGNAYEETIQDPKRWGITQVCDVGGCK